MLEAKSPYSRLATSTLTLLLLAACAWLLARKVPPLNAALLVLLGSSIGALAVDFAARRWRGAPGSTHFLWVAAGACLGSGLCLLLLPRPEEISWMRSYGLGALTAIPSGTLICLALRARCAFQTPWAPICIGVTKFLGDRFVFVRSPAAGGRATLWKINLSPICPR